MGLGQIIYYRYQNVKKFTMKLLFIDETDRQQSAGNGRAFFSICGLSINEKDVIEVNKKLEDIKNEYSLSNLKDARKTSLTEEIRLSITKNIAECLSKYDIKIRGIVMGSDSLSYMMNLEDIYIGAISFILERFTLSLMSETNTGLVVFDTIGSDTEKKLRLKFYRYVMDESLEMRGNHLAFYKDYIYPSILFSDDSYTNLIQAVDLIATSLNNALINCGGTRTPINIMDLPNHSKFLQIYWPLFMTSPAGKVEGWGIKIWY